MILPGLALADALVLQTGQGREHVHRRGQALAVQVPAQNDLALGDVAGQIRDGVGHVVLGHGQDGDHGDGALVVPDTARPLIHGGQVRVHVARVAAAPRHLLAGRGDLPQGLGIVGDVGDDDQHVHAQIVGQILRRGDGHTGGGDTLDGRVVGQVDEGDGPLDGAGLSEIADEEVRLLEGDAHGGEDHGELFVGTQHPRLTGDLGRQLGVGQAAAGEHGELLAPDQGVQAVDGGHAGLDELGRIVPGGGVHGVAVDVEMLLRDQGGAAVLGLAHAVEDPAQHIGGHVQLDGPAHEAGLGGADPKALGALEELHQRPIAVDLQHLAPADGTVLLDDLHQLVVLDALHLVHQHQGADDLGNGTIFLLHQFRPPSTRAPISSPISCMICS